MINFEGTAFKVCVVTPAGRKKHLAVLKQYVYREMAAGLVDEWQLWKNTGVPEDVAYLDEMAAENSRVNVIDIGLTEFSAFNIYKFYQYTVEDDTVYLRFDDDIVWVQGNAMRKLVLARLQHLRPFVVSANIVNNTLISWIHQDIGALDKEHGLANFTRMDEVAHKNELFAENTHQTFMRRHQEGSLNAYYYPDRLLMGFDSFSISCFAYFGHDLQPIDNSDEELWISSLRPQATNRPCLLLGDALVVHYGYHTQRPVLEQKPYLFDFYASL